jgi:hypothetical protein
MKPEAQAFRESTHFRPVDASHSFVPQAQSMEFAALPSVVVQAENLEHVLIDKEQNRPVDVVQSVVPHAQSSEFATLPSIVVQGATLEHELRDDVQNLPSSVSHILLPHMQSVGLTTVPSVLEQVVPVQQIQVLILVQGPELVESPR